MAKAYLNLHLRVEDGHFVPVKAHIGEVPGRLLGEEVRDSVWAVIYEHEAATPDEARRAVEFLLDRGALRQFPVLVLLKQLVEAGRRRQNESLVDHHMMP